MEFYDFYTGQDFDSYRFLGAHPSDSGVTFCTFAPAAQHVSIIGDFNGWTDTGMGKIYDGNFWECMIPNAAPGMRYKYRIYKKGRFFSGSCRSLCILFRSKAGYGICHMWTFRLSFSR